MINSPEKLRKHSQIRGRAFAVSILLILLGAPNLSMSAPLFDLSELSPSQQEKLWTQVDNWAVAVVLANFCKQATLLEERMTKIAISCVTSRSIKTVLDRFHAKMDSAQKKVWDCMDSTVKTFVAKTVAKADRLVYQAGNACEFGAIYQKLLPYLQ
jgi:hypothetical protein